MTCPHCGGSLANDSSDVNNALGARAVSQADKAILFIGVGVLAASIPFPSVGLAFGGFFLVVGIVDYVKQRSSAARRMIIFSSLAITVAVVHFFFF